MGNEMKKCLCRYHISRIRCLLDIMESHVRAYPGVSGGVVTMIEVANREVFKELRETDEQMESIG